MSRLIQCAAGRHPLGGDRPGAVHRARRDRHVRQPGYRHRLGRQRPRAGYFPFYIGLLLSAASLGNLLLALCRWRALGTSFVARTAFRRVLAVFLPIAAYVAAMPFAGIYLASALFIAWFMWRDRSRDKPYGVPLIVTLSCGAALASYLVFAVWFKVPLDAGILVDLAAFVGSARP